MRLFLIGEMLKHHEMEWRVAQPATHATRGLCLIARHFRQPENWFATNALPGIRAQSDFQRLEYPQCAPIEMAAEVVYSMAILNIVHFLETCPEAWIRVGA